MTESKALRALREAIVLEHMESQNDHDFDTSLNTFPHPRYEIMASGQVFEGVDAVRGYWQRTRAAFPDQRNKIIDVHHADDAVIVEFELQGTHLGSLIGEEVTGRSFKVRMAGFFLFDKDILVCERIYGDTATVMAQLGMLDVPEKF
ncbi:ester cyclase [Lentzea sp. NEAU-D7]|uniref:ester cyclase n=1 Tax=Lentzea sp. NEAU-D7 TaxID=2994667 RepID=UPI00224AFC75|nr:ester cyclase [Lentzea sp. NEAU-D7]MCX2949780.1 ester cyclase [Lentzea sp. NEAU-D7]MCX2951092.1 ester cyclase [Lentzea sp. NEAU-D7]